MLIKNKQKPHTNIMWYIVYISIQVVTKQKFKRGANNYATHCTYIGNHIIPKWL